MRMERGKKRFKLQPRSLKKQKEREMVFDNKESEKRGRKWNYLVMESLNSEFWLFLLQNYSVLLFTFYISTFFFKALCIFHLCLCTYVYNSTFMFFFCYKSVPSCGIMLMSGSGSPGSFKLKCSQRGLILIAWLFTQPPSFFLSFIFNLMSRWRVLPLCFHS